MKITLRAFLKLSLIFTEETPKTSFINFPKQTLKKFGKDLRRGK